MISLKLFSSDLGAALLLNYINQTKGNLSSLGVNIPVGNAEAGSYFNTEVLENVAYGVRCFGCIMLRRRLTC